MASTRTSRNFVEFVSRKAVTIEQGRGEVLMLVADMVEIAKVVLVSVVVGALITGGGPEVMKLLAAAIAAWFRK